MHFEQDHLFEEESKETASRRKANAEEFYKAFGETQEEAITRSGEIVDSYLDILEQLSTETDTETRVRLDLIRLNLASEIRAIGSKIENTPQYEKFRQTVEG